MGQSTPTTDSRDKRLEAMDNGLQDEELAVIMATVMMMGSSVMLSQVKPLRIRESWPKPSPWRWIK